jgi:hypothetical protein
MDKIEATKLLETGLERFRGESYDALVSRVGDVVTEEVGGESGTEYQLEYTFMWDGHPGGAVLVIGSIDDGGWRAFAPLTQSFLKRPGSE